MSKKKQVSSLPQGSSVPSKGKPDGQPLPTASVKGGVPQKKEKKRFDKKWLILLALVFFLFSVIFIVPVGSLPGLRNLVWKMGFSTQDTQSMSFGQALLAWAGEGTRHLSSKYRSSQEISLFDKRKEIGFNPNGPQSGLFDLSAVNDERRKRGLSPEGLYGAYVGEEQERAAMNRKVNGLSQEAQQDQAEKNMQEVYFGADADLMARAAQTAGLRKGTLDTATLLPKGAVVGSVGTDWFGLAVEKASRLSDEQLDKAFGVSTTAAPLSHLDAKVKVGDKPKRDLAQVWLMSKASNRAKQLMLKKQLAAAGYVGMEMPKKVYDSLGENSGVMMSGEEMVGDLEEIQAKLLNEEQCRDLGLKTNDIISEKLSQSRELVTVVTGTVPKSCDSTAMTSWKESLIEVRENCASVKDTLKVMSENCGTVKLEKEGRCETVRLDTYAEDLSSACNALAEAEAEYAAAGEDADDSKVKEARANVENVVDMLTDEEVFNTFNISGDGKGDSGSGDFFPEVSGQLNL